LFASGKLNIKLLGGARDMIEGRPARPLMRFLYREPSVRLVSLCRSIYLSGAVNQTLDGDVMISTPTTATGDRIIESPSALTGSARLCY
jgi:hypothetical protein